MSVTNELEIEEGPRSKRAPILKAAVEYFGEVGYEATKWADVADRVGIGQTALYHYFESKAHCLLTIMQTELQRSHDAFFEATAGAATPDEALRAAVRSAYDATDHEVLQLRILQSNMSLLAGERASEREESARLASREITRRIEASWTDLLRRGMKAGAFPKRDPQLLARALLGLIVSVWRWYRPGGRLSLAQVSDFMTDCCVHMVES